MSKGASGTTPASLYDRPVLAVDTGTHTAFISKLDADHQGRFLVTASYDKTVRVWDATRGKLQRTIRLPAGPGHVGQAFAAAISPDGTLVAVGGWTRRTEDDPEEQVYVFERGTGRMVHRIGGLPSQVYNLAFSPDGTRLALVLAGGCGVRLLDPTDGKIVGADEDFAAGSYGLAFDTAGRLATASLDGLIRLYDPSLGLLGVVKAPDGRQCYEVAFSPDGRRLAVGYANVAMIDVLDGSTLGHLFLADPRGVGQGALLRVAWSMDGDSLFAAGEWRLGGVGHRLRRWPEGGRGSPSDHPLSQNTVTALCPLPGGKLAFAASDPRLGVLDGDEDQVWTVPPATTDFRNHPTMALAAAADGARVAFGSKRWDKSRCDWDSQSMVFFVPACRLAQEEKPDDLAWPRTTAPGLALEGWFGTLAPTLNGKPLALFEGEHARSLAIAPDGTRFVLGAEWSLHLFDRAGTELWWWNAPGATWAVNVSGDGRLVVATHHDGTIRWYRVDDGTELLAFLPLADRTNWVAWTPEGFYAATPGAHGILRWHVNRGWNEAADAIPVADIPGSRRPAVLPLVLQELEMSRALGLAELAEHRRRVQIRTHSHVPPGAKLHLLTIGISAYNEEHARHLRLTYAHQDAWDVASALLETQTSLYADVKSQVLCNAEATKAGILRALHTMRFGMAAGTGRDLAVVHFSGHGALIDGKLYLLPHEVDARDPIGTKATALAIEEFRSELLELGQRGRVLALLDACRSGAATIDGTGMAVDATLLRSALAGTNISVLTSSNGTEPSREDARWSNGAFTEVLLEALGGAADTNRDGLISVVELTDYLTTYVPRITDGRQTPGIEVRFQSSLFVAGL